MAITPKWYLNGVKALLGGSADWDTDSFKLSLHTSGYTPDQDAHDFFNDATSELATANGYTAGGVALASCAILITGATNDVALDANDVAFTFTGAVTWRWGVIRKARGGASSADELIAFLDFGTDQTVSTPYTVQFDPAGIVKITPAA